MSAPSPTLPRSAGEGGEDGIDAVLGGLEKWVGRPRSKFGRWWLRRLTTNGRFLMVVLSIAGSTALAIGNQEFPLYYFASLLLGVFLVDWVVGLALRPRVKIERTLPERCAAGARIPVRARVTNVGRLPAFDVAVTEASPSKHVDVDLRYEYFPALAPGESVELSYAWTPERRGSYDFAGPIALSAFPFGLKHAQREVKDPARVLVYPRFARLDAVDLPVGRKYQPGGLALVSEVGDSGEFVGNREYRPGDRLRDIHHAAWARRGGQPVVREFQEEYLCRIALVADTFGTEAALEAGISLGAAIADVLSRQEYIIDVFAAGPDLYHFQAGRSLAYLDNILDVLACVEACPRNPFDVLAPALSEELGQLSTAVAVLLDWDDAREQFVHSLEQGGVAVKIVVVRDGPCTKDPLGYTTAAGAITLVTPAQVESGLGRI